MNKAYLVLTAFLSVCSFTIASELENARFYLESGKTEISIRNFKMGMHNCKKGIENISAKYINELVIDDTVQKYVIAEYHEKNRELEIASNLYCNILSSRIGIYESNSK